MVVGLTGGIGSGKSAALAAFARHGCATLSSDAVVHELYRTPEVRDAVVGRFGSGVLGADGEVDRKLVGARAFGEPEGLRFLETLLHPLVAERAERWRAESEAAGARLLVHEVPLLFEAGLEGRYDRVVVVTAGEEVRRARAPGRFAGASPHQLPEEEKVARANDVYVNDGTLAELDAWVGALVARLAP